MQWQVIARHFDMVLVDLVDVILHALHLAVGFLDEVMIVGALFEDLLLVWHEIIGQLADFVSDVRLEVFFEVSVLVLIALDVLRTREYECLESVLLVINLEHLLDKEIQLCLLLVKEARTHVLDPVVGHTDFGN